MFDPARDRDPRFSHQTRTMPLRHRRGTRRPIRSSSHGHTRVKPLNPYAARSQQRRRYMSAHDEAKAASAQFYAALNQMLTGHKGAMDAIWSHDASATTMHPIG